MFICICIIHAYLVPFFPKQDTSAYVERKLLLCLGGRGTDGFSR
jgi:hypothetical protein